MNFTPPPDSNLDKIWTVWFSDAGRTLNSLTGSGATADRPTVGLYVGRPYFDTTLGQPIWYDGTGWVDATGASA